MSSRWRSRSFQWKAASGFPGSGDMDTVLRLFLVKGMPHIASMRRPWSYAGALRGGSPTHLVASAGRTVAGGADTCALEIRHDACKVY